MAQMLREQVLALPQVLVRWQALPHLPLPTSRRQNLL
jgi:hypothetical protein